MAGALLRRAWRRVVLGGALALVAGSGLAHGKTATVGFVAKKPLASTQVSKTVAERGGVNPCNTKDPGFALYDHWSRGIDMGIDLGRRNVGMAEQ